MDRINVVVLGPPHAGKSCLIARLAQDIFLPGWPSNCEDSYNASIKVDGREYRLTVWDLAQTTARENTSEYRSHVECRADLIQRAQGIVIVFSPDCPRSPRDARNIYNEAVSNRRDPVPTVFVANTANRSNHQSLSADTMGILRRRSSIVDVKNDEWIDVAMPFTDLVRQIINKAPSRDIEKARRTGGFIPWLGSFIPSSSQYHRL